MARCSAGFSSLGVTGLVKTTVIANSTRILSLCEIALSASEYIFSQGSNVEKAVFVLTRRIVQQLALFLVKMAANIGTEGGGGGFTLKGGVPTGTRVMKMLKTVATNLSGVSRDTPVPEGSVHRRFIVMLPNASPSLGKLVETLAEPELRTRQSAPAFAQLVRIVEFTCAAESGLGGGDPTPDAIDVLQPADTYGAEQVASLRTAKLVAASERRFLAEAADALIACLQACVESPLAPEVFMNHAVEARVKEALEAREAEFAERVAALDAEREVVDALSRSTQSRVVSAPDASAEAVAPLAPNLAAGGDLSARMLRAAFDGGDGDVAGAARAVSIPQTPAAPPPSTNVGAASKSSDVRISEAMDRFSASFIETVTNAIGLASPELERRRVGGDQTGYGAARSDLYLPTDEATEKKRRGIHRAYAGRVGISPEVAATLSYAHMAASTTAIEPRGGDKVMSPDQRLRSFGEVEISGTGGMLLESYAHENVFGRYGATVPRIVAVTQKVSDPGQLGAVATMTLAVMNAQDLKEVAELPEEVRNTTSGMTTVKVSYHRMGLGAGSGILSENDGQILAASRGSRQVIANHAIVLLSANANTMMTLARRDVDYANMASLLGGIIDALQVELNHPDNDMVFGRDGVRGHFGPFIALYLRVRVLLTVESWAAAGQGDFGEWPSILARLPHVVEARILATVATVFVNENSIAKDDQQATDLAELQARMATLTQTSMRQSKMLEEHRRRSGGGGGGGGGGGSGGAGGGGGGAKKKSSYTKKKSSFTNSETVEGALSAAKGHEDASQRRVRIQQLRKAPIWKRMSANQKAMCEGMAHPDHDFSIDYLPTPFSKGSRDFPQFGINRACGVWTVLCERGGLDPVSNPYTGGSQGSM